MKKLLLNLLAFLLLAGWVVAQQNNSDQSNAADQSSSKQGDRQITLQGCLAKSGSDYTLRANGRKPYQLQGHSRDLDRHLGEMVEVQGYQSNSLSTTGPTEASSGSASPLMVQVNSIRKIEDKCQTSTVSP
jgi:hypothetical protein